MDGDGADPTAGPVAGWVFREPMEEIDDWVHGFFVGGIASATDDLELARAYAEAAAHLVSSALEAGDAGETWRRSHPILYLLRHALELYLKVRPARLDHRLGLLIEEFEGLLRQRFGSGMQDVGGRRGHAGRLRAGPEQWGR